MRQSNSHYWEKYNNLQRVKHDLIRCYLNGWLPKLGSWSRRIIYLDTHAGRGKHLAGQEGSPIVALRTFLDHKWRDRIFSSCEVIFYFIEIDNENCRTLKQEVSSLGKLPEKAKVHISHANCFVKLRNVIDSIKESGRCLAPAFVFLDPYGFTVPAAILRELMALGRVELFMNVIWRELSMAITQASSKPGMAKLLDNIFDGSEWQQLVPLDFDTRAKKSANLFRDKIGAQWATYIRMLGKNSATKYMLLHLTNHNAGRDLMKECMWAVSPEGGFYARRNENIRQQFLITPKPDLGPLKKWVIEKLESRPTRWKELTEEVREEIWLPKHLNSVVRKLHQDGIIDGRIYGDRERFALKQNPELYLIKRGD